MNRDFMLTLLSKMSYGELQSCTYLFILILVHRTYLFFFLCQIAQFIKGKDVFKNDQDKPIYRGFDKA